MRKSQLKVEKSRIERAVGCKLVALDFRYGPILALWATTKFKEHKGGQKRTHFDTLQSAAFS